MVQQPLKLITAGQQPFALAQQLGQMVLHATIEIDDVGVDVVDGFAGRGLFVKQYPSCAAEHFGIAGVLGNQRYDGGRKAVFTAQPAA